MRYGIGRPTTLPKWEIVSRYNAGETVAELARAFGRAADTMCKNLHRWGANIRRRGPKRQHRLNESFFETIDTERKAYWLGFAFTDGSVVLGKGGQFVFRTALQGGDVGHLRKLADDLGSDVEPTPDNRGKYYLLICSAKLCRDLISHGCIPNKTGKHGTPKLPSQLYRHFYRGATDGDGSIWVDRCGHWGYNLTGAPRFIADARNWLIDAVELSRAEIRICGKNRITRTFAYQGGRQVEAICRELYTDARVYLDRKFDMFRRVVSRNKRIGRPRKAA